MISLFRSNRVASAEKRAETWVCGHPVECLSVGAIVYCAWCADVEAAKAGKAQAVREAKAKAETRADKLIASAAKHVDADVQRLKNAQRDYRDAEALYRWKLGPVEWTLDVLWMIRAECQRIYGDGTKPDPAAQARSMALVIEDVTLKALEKPYFTHPPKRPQDALASMKKVP